MVSRLVLKNLFRNKLRMTLTVAAIALPMFVFTMARSFVDVVDQFLEQSDKNLRVVVHQKLTFTSMLPQRIRGEIEAMAPPGYIKAVCRTTWYGGRPENQKMYFGSMAADRDTLHLVYPEWEMTDEQVRRFQEEKRAAIMTPAIAKMLNLNVGDRLTLVGTIPPFPKIEFVVAAIPPKMTGPGLYFGLDYYDEIFRSLADQPVGVHNFWIRCSSNEARQWALSHIDEHFANTQYETRTELESQFFATFAKSGGDWIGLVWTVGQLIVIVAIAAAFNTMSMAFRERTGELAVMRALGFSHSRIMTMLLAEGLLLGLIGGSIAVFPSYLLTQSVDLQIPMMRSAIKIPESTVAIVMCVSFFCGLISSLAPMYSAWRMPVAPALRKVN